MAQFKEVSDAIVHILTDKTIEGFEAQKPQQASKKVLTALEVCEFEEKINRLEEAGQPIPDNIKNYRNTAPSKKNAQDMMTAFCEGKAQPNYIKFTDNHGFISLENEGNNPTQSKTLEAVKLLTQTPQENIQDVYQEVLKQTPSTSPSAFSVEKSKIQGMNHGQTCTS